MENPLNITALNDFVFCPVSIYFHSLYDDIDKTLYQESAQINGTFAHRTVDNKSYTGSASIQSLEVYSEKYNLIGKIDLYIKSTKTLVERKKKIKKYMKDMYFRYMPSILQCLKWDMK